MAALLVTGSLATVYDILQISTVMARNHAMSDISTPDLSDASPEAKAVELQFRNYGQLQCFGGAVVTIKCHEDNSLVKACVDEPGEGRVIVVDGGGSLRRALLGDMLAEKAASNGWAGLVINGAVRDAAEIAVTNLGVKALGTCPLKTEKLGMGQRDIALHFGGVNISPGDYIYADNNGVLVSKTPLV
ncbi:MAG: regulator of ribonuclease activity A [Bacteroidia bacterium]|jgi:regulator of ribonuclease activity A